MKQKKKIRFAILVSLVCIVTVAAAVALTVSIFRQKSELKETTEKLKQVQMAERASKNELEKLREDIETLKKKAGALQVSIDGLQEEKQKNEEAGETSIDELEPGEIIPFENLSAFGTDEYFKAYEIQEGDEIFERINGKSFRENDAVSLSDLRYMKLLHYNFDGEIQVGELIVNAALTEDYRTAFMRLFENEYQIQSMYLVDNYWTGDADTTDTASIEENNTSAFNYREVTGGGSLSYHAFGKAVDINPQQNPYVKYDGEGNPKYSHTNAQPYLERETRDHMITHEDICYQIFADMGFTWGGDWANPKDYQHFQKD